MSEEHSALRIHTRMTPAPAGGSGAAKAGSPRRKRLRTRRERAALRGKPRPGDRLLRNSAIACAVLLGILALGNIDQPWAEKAAEGIERALTMHINLDDSIGELTFVRRIMPESALVFLNISGGPELTMPADGEVLHPWNGMQPWIMFGCDEDAPVFADEAGTVAAVSPLSGGDFGLLIDHAGGLESVYAGLAAVSVQSGDSVARGQRLGSAAGNLYYEYRSAGESVDPTERLGL